MKNILFLTDFSESSKHAINYACNRLKGKECTYFLLYVNKASNYATSSLMSGTDSVYNSVVGNYKLNLKTLEQTLKDAYNKPFTTIIDYDNFIDAITQAVKTYKIDLVVAGYNGISNISEAIFGSNTLQIIQKIKTPTLIIPENVAYSSAKHILYALDEEGNLESMLNNPFTNQSGSSLVIRVINNGNSALEKEDLSLLKHQFKDLNHTYHALYNIPLEHAKSFVEQTNPVDLTVLMIKEVSFFKRLFGNNSSAKISKSLKKPLLVMH